MKNIIETEIDVVKNVCFESETKIKSEKYFHETQNICIKGINS